MTVINMVESWRELSVDNRVYDLVGEVAHRYIPVYIDAVTHEFQLSLPGFFYNVLEIFNIVPM